MPTAASNAAQRREAPHGGSSPEPSPLALVDDLCSLEDADLARLLGRVLERRRSGLGHRGDREARTRELAWLQQLDGHVQRHLNLLAEGVYHGRHPKHWLWRSHKQWILDRVRPGERVLDVGCGASAYLLWMAEQGCLVTGCDINPERIAQARAIMTHPNLAFEVRDVTREQPLQPFDVAICSHVIEHLDDPVPMLAALRDNAPRLLVAVPPEDSRWQKVMFRDLGLPWKDDEDHRREYTPDLLREQLTLAGWSVEELHSGIDIKAVAVREAPESFIPTELSSAEYLSLQRDRSERKKGYDSVARSGYLVEQLMRWLVANSAPSVLCVGARNRCELDCLQAAGVRDVVGIDLHSTDPRIRVMDMHHLEWPDDSFDAVFTSHSFEHAFDPARVASEIRRVLRPGGLVAIEVPTGYTPTGVDLWDFRAPQVVADYFRPCQVLWTETGPQVDAAHQRVFRLVLRMES
jgi:2-polyprenyl-3-methyl-5-hydroxy-6-metoxy-1,4-benzoquinol methylase